MAGDARELEGQVPRSAWERFLVFLEMIKFEHTVFALPFAYVGLVLGSFYVRGTWPTLWMWAWTTVAMVAARTLAMTLNRIIDREIDAANPRTRARALPRGLIGVREAWAYAIASFGVFVLAAAMLNTTALLLLPLAAGILFLYSFTKRFTAWSHLVLGAADALAPLGGWVAATASLHGPSVWLFLAVTFWVAGFDVLYALQDEEFDRAHGLHSLPARYGAETAIRIARVFHVLTVLFLLALVGTAGLGAWYLAGVGAAAAILVYEHSLVRPGDLSRLDAAFFTMNGVMSVVLFAFVLLNYLV
ncbi:UbiA-like polyprenyltransferase [Brockia lithotrophica]|uniref:4-hydroxybenzoate polyprenyltransferase n=1 Tax=Brockia lithotrophica TaxID=933949 RepID=A0A660L3E3_9BACL|nr:UbiA-like polyprenyltransferase [Brockia lithotrophica]RKQ88426.1 4-hydroxybenzoate polyprenyltransferase [Brockia lithotrophica]